MEASTTAGDTWPPLEDMPRRNAEARMAQLEKREDLRSFPHVVIMRPGDTWDGIPQVVSDQEVDLVVMDTHERGGINTLIMGSIAEKVIRHLTRPVLAVGPHVGALSLDRFGHILVCN